MLDFKLSKEEWSRKNVNLLHLKVFCCISQIHIDFENIDKLDAKAI